jgi:hypothetical protein
VDEWCINATGCWDIILRYFKAFGHKIFVFWTHSLVVVKNADCCDNASEIWYWLAGLCKDVQSKIWWGSVPTVIQLQSLKWPQNLEAPEVFWAKNVTHVSVQLLFHAILLREMWVKQSINQISKNQPTNRRLCLLVACFCCLLGVRFPLLWKLRQYVSWNFVNLNQTKLRHN